MALLINTLYYDVDRFTDVNFIKFLKPNSPFAGVSIGELHYEDKLIQNGSVTIVGYRVDMTNSKYFDTSQYNETYTFQTDNGSVIGSCTYSDSGLLFETKIPFVTLMVHSGTGIYEGASTINVDYTNKIRKIEIYKRKIDMKLNTVSFKLSSNARILFR